MKSVKSLLLVVCLAPTVSNAAFVDFNNIGPVGTVPPSISAGGVSVSFSNLEISEIGELSNGFGGQAGANQVVAADQGNFNGQFLTASGYGRGQFRAPGFIRTIAFDVPVSDVSMYIADIDAQEGITANAFDESDVLLSTMVFPGTLDLDSQVLLVDFGSLSGIRKVTLVGNDPVGIDNLSFLAATEISFIYDFEASNFDDVFGGTPSPVESVSGSFGFTYERGFGDPVSIVVPDFVNLSIFGFEYAPQDTVVRIFDNGGNVTVIFGGAPDATSSGPFTNDFALSFLVSPSGEVLLPFDFSYRIESILFGWFTLPPDVVINQRPLDPVSLIDLLVLDMIGIGPGTSFTDKLLQARAYVEVGDDQAACEMLNAFLNQVSAQNGKRLTIEEASQAESDAIAIAELIGCN